MIENLKHGYLYERLPAAIISMDQLGLIQAVVGGLQSRIEDLRSYSAKLSQLYSVDGLPDGDYNVVSVVLTSDQGIVYKHSLNFAASTPPAGNTAALKSWAAAQLGLDESELGEVKYDRDMLRYVDSSLLEYLAGTVGAVLHSSSLLTTDEQRASNVKIVDTYFSRLRIKGTMASFDVLGRILGFDDVCVTPLWSRLSPHVPQDIGNPANDTDFKAQSDSEPQQQTGMRYDPLDVSDGPFYTWTGVCGNAVTDTDYYLGAVNGFNPWVTVSYNPDLTVPTVDGVAQHIPAGSYALANGAPNKKAYVDPTGSSFRLEALVEGEALNGLIIAVSGTGATRTLTITDRLSTVKYRSSYFDVALTLDFDKAIQVFGTQPAGTCSAMADLSYTSPTGAGVPVSPYRPWTGGKVVYDSVTRDFYVRTTSTYASTTVPLEQAPGSMQVIATDSMAASATQALQNLEEVRPATRFPRKVTTGFLIDDEVRSASYLSKAILFTTVSTNGSYGGVRGDAPAGDYVAQLSLEAPTGEIVALTAAQDVTNENVWNYRSPANAAHMVAAGTYAFNSGQYRIEFDPMPANGTVAHVVWTATDTEVIRPEPSDADSKAYQSRPEDDEDSVLADEETDVYEWMQQAVVGGAEVDLDSYAPEGLEVDKVELKTAFVDQSGADVNVYGIRTSDETLRLITEDRSLGTDYRPGLRAVAYKGTIKDLADISADDNMVLRPRGDSDSIGLTPSKTDYDVLFDTGATFYHAGVVQGVLVADAVKFFGAHHRQNLVGWLPLNEHPEDDITVRDAARPKLAKSTCVGVLPACRTLDTDSGYYLNLNSAGTVTVSAPRDIGVEMSLSFWIKTAAGTGIRRVLSFDPVFVDLNAAGTTLSVYVIREGATTAVLDHTFNLSVGVFTFIAITRSAAGYTYVLGVQASALGGSVTSEVANQYPDSRNPSDLILAHAGFHDVRTWNSVKTIPELELVRYHAPNKTEVLYPLGFIEVLGNSDKWGLRVLESGWIIPDRLPGSYRIPSTGYVKRYNSEGVYVGTPRFKEVGLGGGHAIPSALKLGYSMPTVLSNGIAITGAPIGAETDTLTPTNVTELDMVNPVRESIWLEQATGNHAVFEVKLSGSNSVTSLVGGTIPYTTEQATGAETILSGNDLKAVYVAYTATTGTVLLTSAPGAPTTAPIWMYLHQRTTDTFTGSSTWDRAGYATARMQGVDITGSTGIADPNTGVLNYPALGQNGQLMFSNTSTLSPGRYRFTIESGNVGRPDVDFEGFKVEFSFNGNIIQTTLLAGKTGANVKGTDVIEFDTITPIVSGTWMLGLSVFNLSRDAARGTARQLVIYSYKLEHLATEVFRIDVNAGSTYCNVTPISFGQAQGGYVNRISSNGGIVSVAQEGTIYPTTDTVTDHTPLANILTAETNDRRESISVSVQATDATTLSYLTSGTIAPASTVPSLPSYSAFTATP